MLSEEVGRAVLLGTVAGAFLAFLAVFYLIYTESGVLSY